MPRPLATAARALTATDGSPGWDTSSGSPITSVTVFNTQYTDVSSPFSALLSAPSKSSEVEDDEEGEEGGDEF